MATAAFDEPITIGRDTVTVCRVCHVALTEEEFLALPLVNHQHVPADDMGPEMNIELRNHTCGSTISVDHGPKEKP